MKKILLITLEFPPQIGGIATYVQYFAETLDPNQIVVLAPKNKEASEFDEKLKGYALGEDKLFSYPIFESYPNSLFIDPKIKCEHCHADSGRPQDKKWVEMKIEYTYYLWKKLFAKKGFKARVAYWWANIGDLKIVFLSVILRQNSFKFWWWHVKGYWKILCKR